jgi:hypothetical protein
VKWDSVRYLREWLDNLSGDQDIDVMRVLRITKVSEEVGEVAAALIGVTGQNPRKGTTHTWGDVEKGLCDVIIAAAVALDTLTDNAPHLLSKHLASRVERAKLVPGQWFRPTDELLASVSARHEAGESIEYMAHELGVARATLYRHVTSYRNRKEASKMKSHGADSRGRRRSRRHKPHALPDNSGTQAADQQDHGGG